MRFARDFADAIGGQGVLIALLVAGFGALLWFSAGVLLYRFRYHVLLGLLAIPVLYWIITGIG